VNLLRDAAKADARQRARLGICARAPQSPAGMWW